MFKGLGLLFKSVWVRGIGAFLASLMIVSAALDQISIIYSPSDSLPYRLFLELKPIKPQVGHYAYFNSHWYGGRVIKKVVGQGGDAMSYDPGGNLWVGNQKVGTSLSISKDGRDLTPIQAGIIPQGMVFMKGEHERSFDSRYEELGLIPEKLLGGRVFAIV
jgi:conjugal transfer pilin signal peptidase TrbI